jgi:hypothetical protein
MNLTNEAISGLRKQKKQLQEAIKEIDAEIALIQKDFGETEHPLKKLIKKYRRVANLKPPTDEQCQTLYDLYGEAKVIETMEAMNNWKDITKKVYFYATIKNWLKRDIQPTGRVIKNEYKKVMNEAERQSTNQPEIKKGWLTNNLE